MPNLNYVCRVACKQYASSAFVSPFILIHGDLLIMLAGFSDKN